MEAYSGVGLLVQVVVVVGVEGELVMGFLLGMGILVMGSLQARAVAGRPGVSGGAGCRGVRGLC